MTKTEINRKKVVFYVFTYYWMLIFEGAFRKWLFPQFHEIIFFIRDPVVLLIYIIAWRNNLIKKDIFFISATIMSLLFIPLIFLQAIITKINILTLIYGWRCYFYYIPFAFIIKETFQREDFNKFFKFTLLVSIALFPLVYIQFISPRDSFINSGYSGSEAFVVTGLIVRTTGTFTFTSGQTMFSASLIAMVIYFWLHINQKQISKVILIICTTIAFGTLMLTGSRTAFFMAGLIISFTFLGIMVSKGVKLKLSGIGLLLFLIIIGIFLAIGPFKDSLMAISSRFQEAEASEGSPILRALAPLFIFIHHLTTAPVFGHGLGLTSGGGSKLATGQSSWLLAEDEWSRHIVENGPAFGLIYLIFRLIFTYYLFHISLKSAFKNNILPIILFGFIGFYILAGQMTSVAVLQGYTWLFVGLLMASTKISYNNENLEVKKQTIKYKNIISSIKTHTMEDRIVN